MDTLFCHRSHVFSILLLLHILILTQKGCLGTISCFTCSSRNGSDPECEDPFKARDGSYIERCKVPKRGHTGEFPAHFCIKVTGTSYTSKEKLTIRRCVRENMDSQCGNFRLDDDMLHGCILTCHIDGCNGSPTVSSHPSLMIPTFIALAFCSWLLSCSFQVSSYQKPTLQRSNPSASNQPVNEGGTQHKISNFLNSTTVDSTISKNDVLETSNDHHILSFLLLRLPKVQNEMLISPFSGLCRRNPKQDNYAK